jgi:subtilase family serine protease
LTPADLSSLYAYPAPWAQGSAGAGQTVAIVVAGDYALAESDLGVYRQHFGLPPCTSLSGCLKKVGAAATGQAAQVATSASVSAHPTTVSAIGWAGETDTDTEMVSAVCPNCKIVIAEAASDSMVDLGKAVVAAINANASIVNVSFGAPESSSDVAWSSQYNSMRHVKLVAAAGDWGYGVYYPASDPSAIAVGGTSLSVSGSTISETAWFGTGSGCSAFFSNPGWERPPSVSGTCTRRNVADVSAVADPLTGVAIYDSSLFGYFGGWAIFGGTSVSAPIVAGMNALAANTAKGQGAQLLYAAPSSAFLPVTRGSNGTCSPQYLCTAVAGYNGPAGLGIPQGLGGF